MRFSVLVSFYFKNNPEELDQSLKSIFDNSVKPDEVVLVQDGNISQELLSVVNRYINLHNIKYIIIEKNKGLSYVLNHGLKYVKNDIVFRVDADDINLSHRFQTQLNLFKAGADVCGGDIKEIDNDYNFIGYRKCPKSNEEIMKRLKYRNPLNHMTVGFRKSAVDSVGGYPHLLFREDYGLWAKMIKSGYIFINSGDVLVKARAGKEMYQRRSGFKNVIAEIKLQTFMVRLGVQSIYLAYIIGALRSLIFLLPNKVRGFIYETFLRK